MLFKQVTASIALAVLAAHASGAVIPVEQASSMVNVNPQPSSAVATAPLGLTEAQLRILAGHDDHGVDADEASDHMKWGGWGGWGNWGCPWWGSSWCFPSWCW
ncbi:hypothetical protein BGZ94_005657 [Podila epigama]|nr:hypothetical protein BGZ94_005657 [Podila epigama]